MEVWVVMNGEKHEGGRVVAIHRSYESALTEIPKIQPFFEGGWIKQPTEDDSAVWYNGCDFISIRKHPVLRRQHHA